MGQALFATNRNFRLILSAGAISNLGNGVSAVAAPWLATLLTRDVVLVSLVAMAGRLPWFLFSLPAGVWTDRADLRRLMVNADLVRLALTLGVLGLALSADGFATGPAAILTLAALSFLIGAAEVVHDNAAQTMLPAIVAPADLERANGQLWSAETVMSQFLGPPLAGVLIAAGIVLPFGFDAATFALAAGIVWLMTLPSVPRRASLRFHTALAEGLRWMRGSGLILRLAIMLGLINAIFMGGLTVLVLYAQEVLGLGSERYGLLLTCGAAGGVLGGLLAPRLAARIGMRRSLLTALACFTALHLMLGLFSSVALTGLALFLEAAGGMLWNVVTVSYRQRVIPPDLLGRVNSVYRFFGWGAMPFGALGAGALVTALEPGLGRAEALHAPYLLGAAVSALLFLYAALGLGLTRAARNGG